MGRESQLNHLNARSASHCSKARLLLQKVRCSFVRAQEQKLRSRLRTKRNLICGHVGDEGTSSQTPLENVETVLEVFRETLCEFSVGSCTAVLEIWMASELTLNREQSSQTLGPRASQSWLLFLSRA